jgi:hypothetical protein
MTSVLAACSAFGVAAVGVHAQTTEPQQEDPVRILVGRLDLERHKETIRGLTQFGDRRQGTDRNRAAVDWIEAQLKSYGCENTERIHYEYNGRQLRNDSTNAVDIAAGRNVPGGRGGGRGGAAADTAGGRGRGAGAAAGRGGGGGGRGGGGRANNPVKGFRGPTGVNTNPELQPNPELRAINAQWDTPGPRSEVYCTKIGSTIPGEMYIIGAHMDGHGYGAAANDDASGTAIVMELARILHMPDVQTERSILFILFNNEETGGGARAYVTQRSQLQGIEEPAGSGRYPEPRWRGMIQHDMMLWDHGAPGPDGKVSPEQRREADINIEFAGSSRMADSAQALAWFFRRANDRYATDYPAAVGDRMSNTDSGSFQDLVAAISLRENERLAHTGTGWNPTWHQPIDVFETFSDLDFKLGLTSAQTTLAGVALLAGATIRR